MDQLINELIKTLLDAAVVTFVPLILAFLVQHVRKAGYEVSAQQQARAQAIAEQAVLAAEEWAADRIKRKIPTAQTQKFERALDAILTKVPGVTEQEAQDLIHTALPKLGLGATDFLSQVRAAATNDQK